MDSGIAFDGNRYGILMFGGEADRGGRFWEALNDTWFWDGTTWQQIILDTTPLARWGGKMIYDKTHKSIILFGGVNDGAYLEDTWLWDGKAWSEQHPIHHPAGRSNFGITFDEVKKQVVLFGGESYTGISCNDTWIWNGIDWSILEVGEKPPIELTYDAQITYSPSHSSVILYGIYREKIVQTDVDFAVNENTEIWILDY